MEEARKKSIQRVVAQIVKELNHDIYIPDSQFIVDVLKICQHFQLNIYETDLKDDEMAILNAHKREILISNRHKNTDRRAHSMIMLSRFVLYADHNSQEPIISRVNRDAASSVEEVCAEYMASLLLIPHTQVIKRYDFDEVLNIYQVAPYILEVRLHNLGYPIFKQTGTHLKCLRH